MLKEPTKGYIWEATKGEDTIYLVGTIHVKDKDTNFLNDNIKQIIEKTEGVALELDLSSPENVEKAKEYTKSNNTLTDVELKDFLSEDESIKLDQMLKNYNIQYTTVKNLNVNTFINLLSSKSVLLAGLEAGGLDEKLTSEYKDKNKKIIELETFDFQMEMSKSLGTIDVLKKMLNDYTTDSVKATVNENKDLFKAFSNGDKDFIQAQLEKSKEDPKSYKSVLVDRNINMVNKIDALAKDGGKYMVAVGALHYFGDQGIVHLLEQKGYTIKEMN